MASPTYIVLVTVLALSWLHFSGAQDCVNNVAVGAEGSVLTSANFPRPYADNTQCRWILSGPASHRLRLTFIERFAVENSGTCTADYVVMYDNAKPGVNTSLAAMPVCRRNGLTPSHGPFCGNALPSSWTASGTGAVVQFCTDFSVTGAGWKINVEAIPESEFPTPAPWVVQTVTLSSLNDIATINSPNYPRNYNDNYRAEYVIKNLRPGASVRLSASVFVIGPDCRDQLTIVDTSINRTHTFCGQNTLQTLEIQNAQDVIVIFQTDAFDNFKGFSIDISLVVCRTGQFACDDSDGCYNPSASCDGERHCTDGSDEAEKYCSPVCGVPHFPIKADHTAGRIVGGIVVNKHSIPWQASMQRNGRHFCGGSIISDQWVMSAAHCFTSTQTTGLKVRLGGHALSNTDEQDGSVTIAIDKIRCHPSYNKPKQMDHDYCLLKLKTKIPFRKNIAPACLPEAGSDEVAGTRCMVSGWGDTLMSTPGRMDRRIKSVATRVASNNLRQVFSPVVERSVCNRIAALPGIITERMICAGETVGGTGSCHGDSGGPFVCQHEDGHWIVAGAVSWGPSRCAIPNVPAVYARLGAVTEWIATTIAAN